MAILPEAKSANWKGRTKDNGSLEALDGDTRLKARPFVLRLLAKRESRTVGLVWLIVIVLLFCSRFVSAKLDSWSYVETVAALATFTIVPSFGQQVVMLVEGFDLSIAGVITLAGVLLTGMSLGSDTRAIYVIPIVLFIGLCIGLINGIGVTVAKINPVVMTLGMYVILLGVVLVYTGGTPAGSTPKVIDSLVQGRVAGTSFPTIVIFTFLYVALGIFILAKSSYGRRVYAIGNSSRVSMLSGIRVNIWVAITYALSGFCAALAGIILSGYAGDSFLGMGDPYFLLTLAAVVVGGTATTGGSGYYLGTVGGALLLTTATEVLSGTTLPNAVQQILYGAVIVVGVLVARSRGQKWVA